MCRESCLRSPSLITEPRGHLSPISLSLFCLSLSVLSLSVLSLSLFCLSLFSLLSPVRVHSCLPVIHTDVYMPVPVLRMLLFPHLSLYAVCSHTALCTALHCTVLYCTALHCTALYSPCAAVLHCTPLHCTALHCTVLYCTVLHCPGLPCPAVPCRNRILELSRESEECVFTLMLSADERVRNPAEMRSFLEDMRFARGRPHNAYPVRRMERRKEETRRERQRARTRRERERERERD